MPIGGTIVILDESGEAIPYQPTEIKCISLYPPGWFRSEVNRKPYLYTNESG